VKRLLALLLGGLGLRALLRRRSSPALEPSPADDLRAKLAESRGTVEPEPEPGDREPDGPLDVDSRRADVHARARQAIDELRDEP
jgi:hypothetical protein